MLLPADLSKRLATIVVALALSIEASATLADTSEDMSSWGNKTLSQVDTVSNKPTPTDANDDFSSLRYTKSHNTLPTLANAGRRLSTAGSGSIWVYDPIKISNAALARVLTTSLSCFGTIGQ